MKSEKPGFKIRINRKPNSLTHYVGRLKGGRQFMAAEVFFHTLPIQSDWQTKRKEFVVLHIFDNEGLHLESKHRFIGMTSELDGRDLSPEIEDLIKPEGFESFSDISILPFRTELNGHVYGLVQDNENYCFNLIPNDISFSQPWDGEYDS